MIAYKIIGVVLVLVGIVAFCELERRALIQEGRDQVTAEYKLAAEKQNAAYRQLEADLQEQSNKRYQEYEQKIKQLEDANLGLHADANSLRNAIASAKRGMSQAANCPAGVIETGTVGLDLLAECTGKYEGLAKDAGRLADKTNALIDQIQK